VDAGLDQNEAELGVSVLAVALEVLADSDGLGETMLVRLNDSVTWERDASPRQKSCGTVPS
jgi:hypothetical protein